MESSRRRRPTFIDASADSVNSFCRFACPQRVVLVIIVVIVPTFIVVRIDVAAARAGLDVFIVIVVVFFWWRRGMMCLPLRGKGPAE